MAKDKNQLDVNTENYLKPKIWKVLNWMIFCSFMFVLCSYINAVFFSGAFIATIIVLLTIKLYLINKLPPINFRIYITVFFIIFTLCEYNHLQIVYYKSFKISDLDYANLIADPGIFVGALCNIVFTTKIQVAPTLFFSQEFIAWARSYLQVSSSEVIIHIDAIFFIIFGYIVPVLINAFYAIFIATICVRVKQLFKK
ncbi:hypothetical protein IB642_00925 [Allofrancisella guangzhouensis]|uniref:hypothetical protein n=1 Tax=Allofrancisella guangzhouensis TaxID=594679 RepID=UPI00068BC751|nr:hypothetical protein [Allofrancisella guangzhouensis]MBK2026830.1 hypothetical protein [Allofrancisella guangzhouensis]MBK2043580.1 hypothetical protein [Allofrancisella guangzhouensis]MBK2046327.1 hypothetical protein [Allofrancisella guangzhouensis]